MPPTALKQPVVFFSWLFSQKIPFNSYYANYRYYITGYSKQISYEDLDNILYKLSLGGRVFPDRNLSPEFPEAINILTLIDSTDSDFKEYRGEDSKPFRESYDFLSEFCHPNLLGLTIGSEIIEEGIIKFCKRPNLNEGDYGVLLNLLIMSIEYFFHLYDKSFNLIKKNEDIPYLEK